MKSSVEKAGLEPSQGPAVEAPHITVATIVVKDDKFLMVEEQSVQGAMVYNQPAGHLENGESLQQAAIRETLEETAWHVRLDSILGIYRYQTPVANATNVNKVKNSTNSHGVDNNKAISVTYVRHCFIASPVRHEPEYKLDPDIHDNHWMSYSELLEKRTAMRSPLVLECIEDYQRGIKYPLSIYKD